MAKNSDLDGRSGWHFPVEDALLQLRDGAVITRCSTPARSHGPSTSRMRWASSGGGIVTQSGGVGRSTGLLLRPVLHSNTRASDTLNGEQVHSHTRASVTSLVQTTGSAVSRGESPG